MIPAYNEFGNSEQVLCYFHQKEYPLPRTILFQVTVMVCLHFSIPIPKPIPTQIELGCILMLRLVYSGTIPIHVPIPMQMGTVPNLVHILVPIR